MSIPVTPWTIALAGTALLFAILAMVMVARVRKAGYLADAIVAAGLVLFLAVLFLATRDAAVAAAPATAPLQASLAPSPSRGTCSSLEPGDEAEKAREVLGKPDEVTSASHVRGPGAEVWRYDGSRCSVHVYDGRIEFIE